MEREVVQQVIGAAPAGIDVRADRPDAHDLDGRHTLVRHRGEIAFILRTTEAPVQARLVHHCRLRDAEDGSTDAWLEVVHTDPGGLDLPAPAPLRLRRRQLMGGLDERLRRRLRRWAAQEAEAQLTGLASLVQAGGR